MSTLRRQDPQRRRSASVPPHSSPSRDASTKPKRIHHHHLHRYGPRLLRFLVNPHYSLLLIVAVLSLYVAFPVLADSPLAAFLPPTNPIAPLLFLSYKLDSSPLPFVRAGVPGQYEKGRLDVAFVAFYVVVLSWGRVVLMQGPLRRLAGTCGVRKGGKTGRFIEQVRVLDWAAAREEVETTEARDGRGPRSCFFSPGQNYSRILPCIGVR